MERKYKQTIVLKMTDGKTVEHSFTVRDGASLRVLSPVASKTDLENIIGAENGDMSFCIGDGKLYLYSVINPCTDVEDDVYDWVEVGHLVPNMADIVNTINLLASRVTKLEQALAKGE